MGKKKEKTEIVRGGERKQNNSPPPPTEFPWLLFKDSQGTRNQIFYSLSENSSYVRSVPELSSNDVLNSCHGWLILVSKHKQFSLWNPVTFETIRLPPLQHQHQSHIESCILSSPPSDPDCIVFLFDQGSSSIWFCRLHHKKHRWFKHCYEDEIEELSNSEHTDNYLCLPACCGNKAYARTRQGKMLVRIDIIEPNSLVLQPVIEIPDIKSIASSSFYYYLIGSLKELFKVYIILDIKHKGRHEVLEVQIYKWDLSSMVWERVRSAKDRTFFLSEYEGNSYSVICSEDIGNRIYFTRPNDKSLYTYHIEDETLSISLPCPNLTASWEGSKWVMPNNRITNLCEEAPGMTGKENFQKEQASKESGKEVEGREEERRMIAEEEEKGSNITHLFDLPIDLLSYIITDWLNLHDFMNFRLVSTQCREAAPLIQWKTAASNRLETQSKYLSPWLIFSQENGRLCSFVSPQHTDRYYFQVPESLHDSRIFYSKDGWLLMGKSLDGNNIGISFFNPLTKDVIPYEDLSDLPNSTSMSRFVFSSAPTSSNCVIIVICSTFHNVEIRICRSKAEGWVTFERDSNFHVFQFYTNPIFVDGACYFLCDKGNLGVLRIQGEDCDWEVIVLPEKNYLSFSESYLAEHNGEIFLVLTGTIGGWVRIFVLDKSMMNWKKVEDLGNYTLYVSKRSSLFTVAKSPDTRNMIYFPRFCGEHLVSYSLSTNLLHSSGTADTLSNYHGTMEPLICCWTKPSWS